MSRFPESFYCPITGELMKDPVVDREGNSYERIAIVEWLTRSDTSPITRNRLALADLAPNRSLKNSIEDAQEEEKRKLLKAVPPQPPQAFAVGGGGGAVGGGSSCPPGLGGYNNSGVGSAVQGTLTLKKVDELPGGDDGRDHYYVHGALSYSTQDRVPADIVVVIDVSGSMDDPANTQSNESSGLTILDIVKHAVKTIKQVMGDGDRLAIVSFSDRASIDMPLTRMNEQGKNEVDRTLRTLVPQGSTNLWDGLQTALEVLKTHNAKPDESFYNNSFVFLLTDGAPNIEPPRGHLPMLQKYKDRCGGKLPGTICTFGFGYSLDSLLLRDLSTFGGGMYSFIPDSGLMGTAFINAMSNVMCSSVRDVKIKLEGATDLQYVADKELNETSDTRTPTGVQLFKSAMQSEQSFDFIKHISVPRGKLGDLISMEVEYFVVGQPAGAPPRKLVLQASNHDIPRDNWDFDANLWRLKTVRMLSDLQKLLKNNFDDNKAESNARIRALSANIKAWLSAYGGRADELIVKRVEDLVEDIEGQISEAVSRSEYYQKWGKHFLPSLCKAHDLQQSNNFKDPGIQHYGGALFKSIQDHADDVFFSLPAPKPRNVAARPPSNASNVNQPAANVYRQGGGGYNAPAQVHQPAASASYASSSYAAPTAPVNMHTYHDRSAGCFHGDCEIKLSNGKRVPAKSLVKGAKLSDGSTVVAVMQTLCLDGQADLVKISGGLLITPYHPVTIDGKWTFPADIAAPIMTPCEAIYSFLLLGRDGRFASSINVCGVDCITLCHGIQNDKVASHDFFGTSKIVESLKSSKGFDSLDGVVVLDQSSPLGTMIRDCKTHLVVGLVISDPVATNDFSLAVAPLNHLLQVKKEIRLEPVILSAQ